MKILGHSYVAIHTVGKNKQLLIAGALLPEMFPYIPNKIFTNNQLHEGGKKLFRYLNSPHPNKIDLALGLLSHGVELGADKFSSISEELVSCQKKTLLEKISQAQQISSQFATARLHNYVGLGIDWLLIQNKPELVREVEKTLKEINIEEISYLLAKAFEKDENAVRDMVKTLFMDIYRYQDINSVEGLAQIWARQAGGLPEKDKVNIAQAVEIIKECADLQKGQWRGFLELVCAKVRKNLQLFLKKETKRYSLIN